MNRPEEIKTAYVAAIEKHLDDLLESRVTEMMDIQDFADGLHIHPTHLSNTIKETTSTTACGLYQLKIMEQALRLLSDPQLMIKDIALMLEYEPSQFTKWFKRIVHRTPKQYRMQLADKGKEKVNSEIMTILSKYDSLPLSF